MKFLRILLRIAIVLVTIGTISYSVFYYLYEFNQEEKNLEKTIVQGNNLLSSEEILEIASIPLKGTPLKSIDVKGVESRIQSIAFIDEVKVEIYNQNLIISVKEEQPISYIVLDDGTIQFVSEKAKILPLRQIFPILDLPVIQGIKVKSDTTTKILLQEAVSIVNGIRNYADNYIYTITSELVYKPELRTFLIVTTDKQEILIGNLNNLDYNLQKLLYFWNADKISTAVTGLKTIDLRWSGQVILKSKF